jgi:ABC-type polar amino acid transport system ATPase subunit
LKGCQAPIVSVRDLHKSFYDQPVLRGISLQVCAHELTVIIGPSGSGKSTFLRCLNGLEIADRGEISIAGITLQRQNHNTPLPKQYHSQVRRLRHHVGMVFQQFNLFPHLTVLENVIKAPLVVKKIGRDQAIQEATALLEKVGLERHLHHHPAQLSGGQQQRAAIARALAMSPRIMLYDEPTSALDPSLVDEVLQVMQQLNQEGMTQIVVTHKMSFARDAADKVVYFEDGMIIEEAAPSHMFSQPQDERTRKFLKRYL